MSAIVRLIVVTLVGVGGMSLVFNGLGQRRPSLRRMAAHLARQTLTSSDGTTHGWGRLGRPIARRLSLRLASGSELRLARRALEVHTAHLVTAAVAGLFAPPLLLATGQALGLISIGIVVPLVAALACAVIGPLLVHQSMRAEAAEQHRDLRYQLSSYLDVVTMLLAGNMGNEGALRQAARVGDGRLFVELRKRIMVAEASNRSLVSALAELGDDLRLLELQQISASASLASAAGAPVARTLAAKCATLRSALSAEQESDARVRTGKITIPLVGMSLLIMASVIYPALNFSR